MAVPHRYTSPKLSFLTILKWQITKRFQTRTQLPYQTIPVQSLTRLPEGEYALWLGHATLWMNIGDTTLIIDPVFGNIPLYQRHTAMPIDPAELKADIILITHAHYDHFDKPSVLALLNNNPDTIIVAPMGFWRYLKGIVNRERCFEMEWWESVMAGDLFITFTPSRHWSKRTPFDTNKALWGGYVIQKGEQTLYHAGDSAYGEHFQDIGERFSIDEAFLPIGAYRPEEIMQHNHLNPPEAIRACSDLGAKTLIPIHYGTFRLSDEPLNEPLQWFEQLIQKNSYSCASKILQIGEIYRFSTTSTPTST